jgi:preprotein translocase subunit SecG
MLEFILLGILLISAIFIIVAVIFQKSADEGLSGTIAGGNETFYGKEKSAHTDKVWFKWTLIASIVFVIATLLVYVIQPDYDSKASLDTWKSISQYGSLIK